MMTVSEPAEMATNRSHSHVTRADDVILARIPLVYRGMKHLHTEDQF